MEAKRAGEDITAFEDPIGDADSAQMTGRSSSLFGGRDRMDPAVSAARVRRRTNPSAPAAAGAGMRIGSAPMGGRTPARDLGGDGMINEADRGSAHDY